MRRRSTNYSLAPEHRTEVRVALVGEAFAPHADRVAELVRRVEVNGVVTLHNYLQAHAREDREAIGMIRAQNPARVQREGGVTTTITLELSTGGTFALEEQAEEYSGLGELLALLEAEGTRSVGDPLNMRRKNA